MRILALHNSTRDLTCRSVIGYDLDDILSSNLSNAIFELLRNVMLLFISLLVFTEFKNIGPLSITAMKLIIGLLCASAHPPLQMENPFCFHVPLMGSINLSTWDFLRYKRGPQRVLAGRFVAGDWIVCGKFKCFGIPWILCQIKWHFSGIEYPRNNKI